MPNFSRLLISVAFLLPACHRSSSPPSTMGAGTNPSAFVLTWPNYDGKSEHGRAMYVLNGEALGEGKEGYQRLIERMNVFPTGSTLKVQYTPFDATGGGSGYAVPLSYENNEFVSVAERRRIKIEYPPGE